MSEGGGQASGSGGAVLRERLAAALRSVEARIQAAATRSGRNPQAIRLIAVTKTVTPREVAVLHELGVRHMGENRLEHARELMAASPPDIIWHMIAPLQRRKVRDAVDCFGHFDALDRMSMAEELNKRCTAAAKCVRVLLEVNVSGEEAKHGFAPAELSPVLDQVRRLEALDIKGLMTMAPYVENPQDVRPVFRELRALAARHGLPEVSMGMTNDFEVAVEEGATEVRIGSALFKAA